MGNSSDSGFGKKSHVNGDSPKTDPGAKPNNKTVQVTVLTTSVAFRDWVRADMEYKENGSRPKFT